MKRFLHPMALALLAVMVAPACSTINRAGLKKEISEQAVHYNVALEKTQNEVLLLNIVRAYRRQPMHFSAITQVLGNTSNPTFSPSLSLELPLVYQENNPSVIAGKAASGASATFNRGSATATIAVLDSKEFMQGILNPIDINQLDYYISQGWQKEQLLSLFIRRMVIDGDTFVNRPNEQFDNVARFLEALRGIAGDFEIRPTLGSAVGVPFEASSEDLASLILTAEKQGLTLESYSPPADTSGQPATPDTTRADSTQGQWYQFRRKASGKKIYVGDTLAFTSMQSPEDGAKYVFQFRSTQGILYYLGQIMRYQTATNLMPAIEVDPAEGSKRADVLFYVQKGRLDEATISVEHEGEWFSIPSDISFFQMTMGEGGENKGLEHRSMSVLSLISQLIGLNKSRAELPATGVVSVVGN